MAWPTSATKVNLDSGSDSPSLARGELAGLVDKFNALKDSAAPSINPVFTGTMTISNSTTYGYKVVGVSSNQLDVSDSSLVVVSSGGTVNYFINYITRQRFTVLNASGATITVAASAGNWTQFTLAANASTDFIEYNGSLYRIL